MNASSVTAVTTAPTVPVAAVLVTVLKNHDDKIILFFTTTIHSKKFQVQLRNEEYLVKSV